jgi:hypothetical protein
MANKLDPNSTHQICTGCKKDLAMSNFAPRNRLGVYRSKCRPCNNKISNAWQLKRRNGLPTRQEPLRKLGKETYPCTGCKLEKEAKYFCNTADGRKASQCKRCQVRQKTALNRKRLLAGVCTYCASPNVERGYSRCLSCRERSKSRHKALAKEYVLRGRCPKCSKPNNTDRYLCKSCYDKKMAITREKIAAGYCGSCSSPRNRSMYYCDPCIAKRQHKQRWDRRVARREAPIGTH